MPRDLRDLSSSLLRELDRRVKLYLAFLVVKVSARARQVRKEQCWLLGGMSGRAYADNSAALHRHLVASHPEIRAYWVIDRDSPDVESAGSVGPVLYRQSLKAYIYALQARVHVISHGLADVPGCDSRLTRQAVKVRLGHGLTALKKTSGSPLRSTAAKSRVIDLVPVSSEFEKQNKTSWEFDPDRIVVTGLPRFDELLHRDRAYRAGRGAAGGASILYMPTWRDWLPGNDAQFRATDFCRQVCSLLFHPSLNETLARHGVMLTLYLHVIAQEHLDSLREGIAGLSNVRLAQPGERLQDLIVGSSLLITDYSSIAWDFLYLDKPVLFYQFDVELYNRYRGAYVDLNDLFGPVARDADGAAALVCQFAANGFDCSEYWPQMSRWQATAFAYRDDRNCERTVHAILEWMEKRARLS